MYELGYMVRDVFQKTVTGSPLEVEDGEYEFDSRPMIRVVGGRLRAIGCDSPVHGICSVFRSSVLALDQKYPGIVFDLGSDPRDCTRCKGAGWITFDQPAFNEIISAALAIGMFRGLVLAGVGKEQKT